MQNIAVFSPLLNDQHRAFSIVHEAGAPIDPMAFHLGHLSCSSSALGLVA
jgi:hypothetical protein